MEPDRNKPSSETVLSDPQSPSESEEADWERHSRNFQLKNARVVAILAEGGGAIVEAHPALELNEGRGETYSRGGSTGSLSFLSYGLTFWPQTDVFGDQHTGYEAQIVINGTATNGRAMEIRGTGFIGHDEHGQLDGKFYETPLMLIPSEEDLKQHIERQTDRFNGSVWAPMGEFVWATYGRAINKDEL